MKSATAMDTFQKLEALEEELEALLSPLLGEEAVASLDVAEPLGNMLSFYHETPNPSFLGVSKTPILETNLLFDEGADDEMRRIERLGDFVIYTCISTSRGETSHVSGIALKCPKGSEKEQAFVQSALSKLALEAAAPLMSVLQKARKAGLELSEETAEKLFVSMLK